MGRDGGVSSRGRGKFKVQRGGGRHFTVSARNAMRPGHDDEEESSEEESSEEEESSSEDEAAGGTVYDQPIAGMNNLKLGNTIEPEMSRAERKAQKKAAAGKADSKKRVTIAESESEEESEEEDLQPLKAEPIQRKPPPKPQTKPAEMSRREREAADKKAAAERYQKLHAEGKTDKAKSDLARLQEIRRNRDAAAAQRKAEADEVARVAAEKKEKAAMRRL